MKGNNHHPNALVSRNKWEMEWEMWDEITRKRFSGIGSELSSIFRVANAVAAWPDIHLRER